MEAIKLNPTASTPLTDAQMRAEMEDLKALINGERSNGMEDWIRNKPLEVAVSEFIFFRYNLAYTLEEYFNAVQVWHADFEAKKHQYMRDMVEKLRKQQQEDPAAFDKEMKERMDMRKINYNDKSLLVSHYRSELKKAAAVVN